LLQAAYAGYVDQYLGNEVQLTSITAALVGGVTFAGGDGGLLGPALGALLLTALANLIALLNLSSADQSIVTGIVLLLAVALQGLRLALKRERLQLSDLFPRIRGA
jgi:ribose/xylose/arabinose/galactoside ABC-type transport system permease subunit